MSHAVHLHRPSGLVLASIVLLGSSTNAWSEPSTSGTPRPCPNADTTVAGAIDADFADICVGVARALKFLSHHEVHPIETVSVEVTRRIPPEAGPTAAGCYIERKRRVFVVPYSAFRRNKTWFGLAINREIYRSLAAHEAAHAVASCHFRVPKPTIQAQEYLAYVAMFASMPSDLRTRALRATPTEGFTSLDRFTPLLYMFDPMRFGAEAYRHFSSVADQTAFIQDVLAGKALLE